MQETIDRLLLRVEDLKLNTGTASQIQRLQLVGASFNQIEKVVALDTVLASRLLKIANSSFYGSPRSISTIKQALLRIGLVNTRDLAWALAVHALGGEHSEHGQFIQEHALRVSAAAQLITRGLRVVSPSDALVVGLLHDLGVQLLLEVEALRYGSLLDRYGYGGLMLYAAERKTFGVDHAKLGQLVMEKWELPDRLCMAVSNHHRVRAMNKGERNPVLALPAVVFLSEELEKMCRDGVDPEQCGEILGAHAVNAIVGIAPERFRIAAKNLNEEAADMQRMVA